VTEEQRQAWNACLAKGDEAEIERMKDQLLTEIHTRIMNEDPNYGIAGWK
jgi:alpha-D-ribose 1-methylphosphonate 5-triphosphate synthase subunit PhnG